MYCLVVYPWWYVVICAWACTLCTVYSSNVHNTVVHSARCPGCMTRCSKTTARCEVWGLCCGALVSSSVCCPGLATASQLGLILSSPRTAARSWAELGPACCCCCCRGRAQHPPWSCSAVSRAGEQARAWHLALSREQTVILSSVRHTTNIIRLSNPTQLSRSVVFAICIVSHHDGHSDEQWAEHTSWHVTSDDSRQHQQWWQWWFSKLTHTGGGWGLALDNCGV